jgi:exopolyphosphatase/guanosine-5'-triphosphate,3'-diphosphate pyrophosphatase
LKRDRLAVIDLGSNTFHLLICEINDLGSLIKVYKSRVYVKLASSGLGYIDADSEARGLIAMQGYADQLKHHNVKIVKAVGTSALREAKNGKDIAKKYFQATGIRVDIIDGIQEADYILQGTRSAIPSLDQHGLIMDIGGGSVEFILYRGGDIIFKSSYKMGVSVLHRMFHQSDPISEDQLHALETFIESQLGDLISALRAVKNYYLIGSSGSFEVIQDLLPHVSTSKNWSELNIQQFPECLEKVISSTLEQRKATSEIPVERLDYVVVAFALIHFIIRDLPPQRLFYCDFALKEGVLMELASKHNLD